MAGKKKPQQPQAGPAHVPSRRAAAGGGFELPFSLPDRDDAPTINVPRLTKKFPWLFPALISLAIISFIPLCAIYYNRTATHKTNRWSLIPDMDNQPKWRSQQANMLFADHRASRPWPEGTVARGMLRDDTHMYEGIVGGQWATSLPPQIEVNQALLDRGRERYHIYCSMCHGDAGYGDGAVAKRADSLKEGTWTTPLTYHGDQVRGRPVGHIFNTITNGIRTMPPYGTQISPEDRWAIIAWIRVLQASQNADISTVPAAEREQLEQRKPAVTAPPAAPVAATGGEPPVADQPGFSGEAAPAPPANDAPALPGADGTPPPATPQEGAH